MVDGFCVLLVVVSGPWAGGALEIKATRAHTAHCGLPAGRASRTSARQALPGCRPGASRGPRRGDATPIGAKGPAPPRMPRRRADSGSAVDQPQPLQQPATRLPPRGSGAQQQPPAVATPHSQSHHCMQPATAVQHQTVRDAMLALFSSPRNPKNYKDFPSY